MVSGGKARTKIIGKKAWTKEVSARQEKYKKISCFETHSEFSKARCRFLCQVRQLSPKALIKLHYGLLWKDQVNFFLGRGIK